ncbi:MAG: DUF362 domain-containing protein [Candidatus Thorarchaeota archaeon]|nr:DUF362 domain-containing protein [Candidatus Thorarchaeota archaeon]
MSGTILELNQTLFTSDGNKESFKEILSRLNLKAPVVIKPNWSSSRMYTEGRILDWILSAIDGEVIVVESYAMWRNEIFTDLTQTRDNDFLEMLRKQKKSDFRKNDEWFLEFTGIQEVLDQHDVEYLNISEELWANRICNPELIHKEVEKQFPPLASESLSASVPSRLFDLKGGTLLNLTKPKRSLKENFVSLSLKNMFGMIPTPWRRKYHGENEELLTQSILDINKIYESLFDVKGIIEAVFTTSETVDNPMDPLIHSNAGYIWASDNSIELDALVTNQLGLDPHGIDYLKQASKIFGEWSNQIEEYGRKHRVVFPEYIRKQS